MPRVRFVRLKDHVKPYKLAANIDDQLIWKRKAAKA
jgi:hypothetical protein